MYTASPLTSGIWGLLVESLLKESGAQTNGTE